MPVNLEMIVYKLTSAGHPELWENLMLAPGYSKADLVEDLIDYQKENNLGDT